MDTFARTLTMIAIPLGIINMLGGIVSGIWLAFLGEWGLIGFGILMLIISGMGLGLAMMPNLIFALPAAAMLEKGNKFGGYFFAFLSSLYTICVLVAWCVLVLIYCTKQASQDSIIPVLIWSYGISTGPIAWLAQKDLQGGNENAMVTTFFIEVAYLLTILGILLFGMSLLDVLVMFGVIMTIGLAIQFSMEFVTKKSQGMY